MNETLRVAAVQLSSTEDVDRNLRSCATAVAEARRADARMVVLPENFAYFGDAAGRQNLAEPGNGDRGKIGRALAEMAKGSQVWLLAGGWPEVSSDPLRPFNSATLIDPEGHARANYRKIHLFDAFLDDGAVLEESRTTSRGDDVVTADVDGFCVGLSICYDLRFPELYRAMVARGAEIFAIPSALTRETGVDHWRVLLRARAIESQCWVVAANQCGTHPGGRSTFGHSAIVDPWGVVVAEASDEEGWIIADLDRLRLEQVRRKLPCLQHRRLST